MRSGDAFAPLEQALETLPWEPKHVLDLGTGTGLAAFAIARRFPGATVVGTDVAEEMLAEARASAPPELSERVRFETADSAHLPYAAGSFDLVSLANAIPFFDELARVTAPGRLRALLLLRRPGDADLGPAGAAAARARRPRFHGLCGL